MSRRAERANRFSWSGVARGAAMVSLFYVIGSIVFLQTGLGRLGDVQLPQHIGVLIGFGGAAVVVTGRFGWSMILVFLISFPLTGAYEELRRQLLGGVGYVWEYHMFTLPFWGIAFVIGTTIGRLLRSNSKAPTSTSNQTSEIVEIPGMEEILGDGGSSSEEGAAVTMPNVRRRPQKLRIAPTRMKRNCIVLGCVTLVIVGLLGIFTLLTTVEVQGVFTMDVVFDDSGGYAFLPVIETAEETYALEYPDSVSRLIFGGSRQPDPIPGLGTRVGFVWQDGIEASYMKQGTIYVIRGRRFGSRAVLYADRSAQLPILNPWHVTLLSVAK